MRTIVAGWLMLASVAATASLLLLLAGCTEKQPEKTGKVAKLGAGTVGLDTSAPAAPAVAANDAAPAAAANPSATPATVVCCCESMADAVHFTLEQTAAACARDDLQGRCVPFSECDLSKDPTELTDKSSVEVSTYSDVDNFALALWIAKPGDVVALEVKKKGKQAIVRARVDETWTVLGKVPIDPKRGGNIRLSAQPDGSVELSNEVDPVGEAVADVEYWTIRHTEPHGKVSFKKQK